MQVRIDLDRCIGWGTCEELPQDALAVDEDGGARVEPARCSPHNRGLAVDG